MGMKAGNYPTDKEMQILHVLWERSCSIRQVHDQLDQNGMGRAYTTVATQLGVMLEKGYVQKREQHGTNIFSSANTEKVMMRWIVVAIIENTFGGSAVSLLDGAMAYLGVSERRISEELGRLKRIEEKE